MNEFGRVLAIVHIHVCTHPSIQYYTLTTGKVPLEGALTCGFKDDHPTAEDCSYRKASQFPHSGLRLTELAGTHKHTIRLKFKLQSEDTLIDISYY